MIYRLIFFKKSALRIVSNALKMLLVYYALKITYYPMVLAYVKQINILISNKNSVLIVIKIVWPVKTLPLVLYV
jgi:hypothetical protein